MTNASNIKAYRICLVSWRLVIIIFQWQQEDSNTVPIQRPSNRFHPMTAVAHIFAAESQLEKEIVETNDIKRAACRKSFCNHASKIFKITEISVMMKFTFYLLRPTPYSVRKDLKYVSYSMDLPERVNKTKKWNYQEIVVLSTTHIVQNKYW